jgi:hypothetical protein
MDDETIIAAISAGIAVVAIIPAAVAVREARKQTGIAKAEADRATTDATSAETAANAAKDHADTAERQLGAMQEGVRHAAAHAEAAGRSAGAAEGSKNAQAALLLFEIDRALGAYDDVHSALRGDGWFLQHGDADRAEKWVPVERYMGTFERIHALAEQHLIAMDVINDFYGYRIGNLIADETIYSEKLVKRADGWRRFIRL